MGTYKVEKKQQLTYDNIVLRGRGGGQFKDGQIDIKTIERIPLRTIAFTIAQLCGSETLHFITKAQMQIYVECSQPTIFNVCEGVVANLKGQLTRVKTRKFKNFGYGMIMISFSLERIPLLAP